MKTLALSLMLAGALLAETVAVTRNGKTFHKTDGRCIVMSGDSEKAKVERTLAESKGLRGCKSCYRVAKKGSGGNGWAFPK